MVTTKRVNLYIALLQQHYPGARCSLNYKTVHQLLVATILSAQCTDERVNKITPALFRKYRSVKQFAEADLKELATSVFATGFHNAKAKAIKMSAQQLVDEHQGRIPQTLTELVLLHGVGRKTASVVLGAGYGLAEGVVVDTHVGRISRRLGLTSQKDPVKAEKDLMQVIPHEFWIIWSHWLIDHGRALCKARRPACSGCFLNEICPSTSTRD